MGFISSLIKQRRIGRISRVLGAPLDTSRFIEDLTTGKPSKHNQALDDLLDLCESDSDLHKAMQAHGATRETLRALYKMLIANGAGQWVGGHFVAVSALCYGFPLLFLLQNLNTLPWSRICVLLIEYFERNEAGPVQLELRGPADPNDPLNAVWELEQRVKRRE